MIVNEARCTSPPWPEDLVDRVIENLLEGGNSALSVYLADTVSPLDCGHAMAVIAVCISQDCFQGESNKWSKYKGTVGTVTLPAHSLTTGIRYKFTPRNNLGFYPASERHYDLQVNEPRVFARWILDAIHEHRAGWTFIKKEDKTYRIQAALAYSHCLSRFGAFDEQRIPRLWHDGPAMGAARQIEILRFLADYGSLARPVK